MLTPPRHPPTPPPATKDSVVPPHAARALDLVAAVWPESEEPRPDTLLYVLLGEGGAQGGGGRERCTPFAF
jgi:hypothetical protein